MVKLILLMTFQSCALVLAQVFLKIGLTGLNKMSFSWNYFCNVVSNYYFWLTGISMLISGIIWLYVIKRYEFSVAYPLVSISYIFSLLSAAIVFKEEVPITRWVGVVIVMVGIILIVKK